MAATVQRFLLAALPLLVGACDALLPRRPGPPAEDPAAAADSVRAKRPRAARAKPAPVEPVADEGAVFGSIRSGLRRLVVAEQTYFAENGTYTSDLDQVRFRPEPDITIEVLWATRDGWAARGYHPGIPGKDCVVYVGRSRPAPATRKYGRQADEGVPACDSRAAATRPVPAPAATAPPRPEAAEAAPATASGLDAVSPIVQMKVDLRHLARSQELWYGTQGAYSRRVEPFAMQYLWHKGVTVRILSAGRHGWSAKATHARLPGKSCVIWYGPATTSPVTDQQQRAAERAGVPACDDPS